MQKLWNHEIPCVRLGSPCWILVSPCDNIINMRKLGKYQKTSSRNHRITKFLKSKIQESCNNSVMPFRIYMSGQLCLSMAWIVSTPSMLEEHGI
jgi:hypothetical protein